MTIIKKNINKLLVSLGILLSVSCSSDVNVMQVDEANYQVSNNNYAMLSNNNGLQLVLLVSLYNYKKQVMQMQFLS